MPAGSDWREMLAKIANKTVILILAWDFSTGTTGTYSGMEQFGFRLDIPAWESEKSIIQIWRKNE